MNNLSIVQKAWLGAGIAQHMLSDNRIALAKDDTWMIVDLETYELELNETDLFQFTSFADVMDYAALICNTC